MEVEKGIKKSLEGVEGFILCISETVHDDEDCIKNLASSYNVKELIEKIG
jgi:hypothetical protein